MIFINMVNKNKKIEVSENEPYLLPSTNDEMREFISKFRVDMMEHVISSIKFAHKNNLNLVEVFQFNNTSFVVTICEREYIPNLIHISNFYKKNEIYELCPRVDELHKLLKYKHDEKEKTDKSNPDKPT